LREAEGKCRDGAAAPACPVARLAFAWEKNRFEAARSAD
jgi:hypothetical protein